MRFWYKKNNHDPFTFLKQFCYNFTRQRVKKTSINSQNPHKSYEILHQVGVIVSLRKSALAFWTRRV